MIKILLISCLVLAITSMEMDQEIFKQFKSVNIINKNYVEIDSDNYGKTLIDAL